MKILAILTIDCRTPDRQIGKKVGLSGVSVKSRITKMVRSGVIQNFTMKVEPASLGYGVIYMTVPSDNEAGIVKKLKLVGEPFFVVPCLGDITACAIVVEKDMEQKTELVKNLISNARIILTMDAKESEFRVDLTKTDFKILEQLLKSPKEKMWASLFFDAIHPGTFFSSTGLGTMGWGFPAAIGAKVARPDVPVLDIAGDGSFNMTENSLATSVLEDIPVIVFLINNFSLGMVAQWQRTFYDRRMIGIDLKKCPDYVKLAESYGAQGIRAQSLDELGKAVKVGLNSDVATVIDIPIDPEEDVLPFVAPGTSLKDMILPS